MFFLSVIFFYFNQFYPSIQQSVFHLAHFLLLSLCEIIVSHQMKEAMNNIAPKFFTAIDLMRLRIFHGDFWADKNLAEDFITFNF